jgi:hypothetical protein
MRWHLCCLGVLVLAGLAPAARGQNANATLALHAAADQGLPCAIPPLHGGPDPCSPGPPLVQVPVGTSLTAYLLARNYTNVAAVQTALAWSPSWARVSDFIACRSNQLTYAPETCSTGMTILCAFDVINGGATSVIGRIEFDANGPGCLTQPESPAPLGTVVVTSSDVVTQVPPAKRGSICAGSPGVDACN